MPAGPATRHAPPDPDARLIDSLRADLAAAHLTVAAVEELLGAVAAAALHREQPVPALRATVPARAGDGPLPTLVRHLLLGEQVSRASLDRALPRLGVAGAERLGLVVPAGRSGHDAVRPLVDLRPYEAHDAAGPVSWWLASDLGETATGAALAADHVLGVGGASVTLAQLTVRTPARRALDLGTGCGIQALHAARHSDAVVATDVSARALAFAAFNAALAGVDLDLRRGSMLEPVLPVPPDGGFDLVVSNPPFVITPRGGRAEVARYEYRDGGRAGDDLVRDLVRDVGRVLAPGGIAQLLGNWEHRDGEDWRDRVGDWLDASGLDAWVVQREVLDPAQYVETWLRDGGTTRDRDPLGWARTYADWLTDFEDRGVDAVGLGLLVLRRPSEGGPTLRRLEEQTGPVRRPLGEHLAAALRAHDWLTAHDDDALLAARLVVAPDVTEERHLRPGAADPTLVLLRQGDGFGRVTRAGTALAGLVGACDGELAVGQILGALAALLETPVEGLRTALLPAVRELVRDGLLRPA
ncbi:MAG TPA: methyltransferase [Actinotalea sp.]|nr:methyltransferase [Actinotalea sp.]